MRHGYDELNQYPQLHSWGKPPAQSGERNYDAESRVGKGGLPPLRPKGGSVDKERGQAALPDL